MFFDQALLLAFLHHIGTLCQVGHLVKGGFCFWLRGAGDE
jgi:hypothetical protein